MGLELDLTEYYFEKVSQKDIFSIVFGNIDFNSYVTNPLRKDNNPGAWFEWKDNILYFKDFAYGNRPLNAIEFLKEYYKIGNLEVYDIIDKVLIKKIQKPEKIEVKVGNKKKSSLNKDKTELYFLPDKFKRKDFLYWNQYKINKSFLIQEDVFPTEHFILTNKYRYIEFNSRSRCYAYVFNSCKKIYCPFERKKFITNCSNNEIFCINTLDYNRKTVVITKSLKDCGVLKNLGLNTIAFQNEGQIPEDLTFLESFKKIIIFYDNDEPGILAASKIREHLRQVLKKEVLIYHLPKNLLLESIKDPADFVKKYGYLKLRKLLKL